MAVALAATGSAGAIVNGESDGNRHPYVVALGFLDANGQPSQFCTGTLLSPTLVLTAGHCTYQASGAVVWAAPQAFGPPASFGIPVTHPDFKPEISPPNTGDLGVVRLLGPIMVPTYGALPTAGYLEDLGPKRGLNLDVTMVGYGAQSVDPFVPPGERRFATARIQNLNSSTVRDYGVKISGVRGGSGKGSGFCFGDSGGPALHGDTNVVVGVFSFGDVDTCTGATYAYRTDTPSARAFLAPFIALP
jgi:hypothetical protein